MPLKRKQSPLTNTPTRASKRGQRCPPQPNSTSQDASPASDEHSSESKAEENTLESELDPDLPELIRSQPYSGPKTPRTQLALSLPPLYKLSNIYKSLTNRALELNIDEFLSHLGSRQLRVVTVCSGTESPLLALEMVRDNLRKHFNRDLNFRHLFSAEIVPFKQAYIERNFHPRFIFRDVAELKDRVAQTAYGTLEKIPKNADMLIAGFSCVDFSGLNNKRKTLDEKGESGGTFWGIIRYAKTYRPRLVILENVKSAPWEKIGQHWGEIGYFAVHVDVDTKAYYLPQTRERGYMFCVDKKLLQENGLGEEDMRGWADVLAAFKRPASSPAGMFLMDGDDRRLEQIERDMALRISSSTARGTVNWARYQVRHQSYRLNQGLGHRRPVSKSQDDGTCQMPDFAWQTWVRSLPERVWDTIDVNFLRKLAEGYDMNHKERCIELSQGVEREIDSRAYGIVGCITPCGIPYITTRGGPLCGLESLALQGLPLDRLLLTQESQRELQDLAGNAMSSTVVGAAILAALIVGHKVLKKGNNESEITIPKQSQHPKRGKITPLGGEKLVSSNMHRDSISGPALDVKKLQQQATSSARYCTCERQSATRTTILRCTLCEHTACSECAGNPSHAYERWIDLARSDPLDFISELRGPLPSRLVVSGISPEQYSELERDPSVHCPADVWNEFLDAVCRAVGDELRFLDVKRSEVWTVLYEGKSSVLKLVIGDTGLCWLLFAKPRETDPALCLIREILSKPIARMVPRPQPQPQESGSESDPGSFLVGDWEICAPLSSSCTLELFGSGSQIPSYEARCGLELKGFVNSKIWTKIIVQGPDEEVKDLELDIRGTYDLLPDCGTANASLHKRPAADGKPTMYLFLDPTKLGEPKNDSFVFSLEHRRNSGYAPRLTVAEVSHKWRSSRVTDTPEYTTVYYRKWMAIQTATLSPYALDDPVRCYNLDPRVTVSISNSGCHDANITLLSLTTPATVLDTPCSTTTWEITDPIDSPHLVREYAWLLQKAAGFSGSREWNEVVVSNEEKSICTVCLPPKPRILWGRNRRGWIKAYEDPYDAALYERQVKSRPAPFLIFRRADEQDLGNFRVTLNVQTLLHQAYGKLIGAGTAEGVSFQWRLVPNSYDARNLLFPKFTLLSNRDDAQSLQPPGFRLRLRPEQLRSLSWMIQQEDENIEPFVEEETEEALLSSLMWRAEGRVTVPRTIRGGILADDVGYGKTAIVLGLIDTQSESKPTSSSSSQPAPAEGLILSGATLIVIPHIMLQQWQSEIAKFLGKKYKVLVFHSTATLAKASIHEIQSSDIILVSWSVLNTPGYYQRMQKFTGSPRVPTKAGRNFDDWFQDAHVSMREQVRVLVNEGPGAFLDSIHTRRSKVRVARELCTYVPSKRLRGKQYELANREKELDKKPGVSYAEISSGDEGSEASDEDEDPEILRARVDQLLKLVPAKPFGAKEENPDGEASGTDSTDEETECEDSSPETSSARSKPSRSHGKKRKRGRARTSKTPSTWNDRKEFNISKNAKKQDWEAVRPALLHAFEFNRLVIDEFTYANTDRLVPLLALRARSKWVLSGTPPLNDFADVNTIAPFLGVHLGIDDEADTLSQNRRLKSQHKQRSEAETFQSFRAPRSEAWHRRRHDIAQIFLDRFARRNVAEIDEIPATEHIILVRQSPAEKAIYLELYKQLMTYNRQLRRSGARRRVFESDQADRLDEIIGSSSSAEEALLKRCTSLALLGRWDDDGRPEAATCASLIEVRQGQLAKLKEDLMAKLKVAAWLYCARDISHENFHKFVESVIRHDFGDMTVTGEVYPLLKSAVLTSMTDDWKPYFAGPVSHQKKPKKNQDADQDRDEDEIEDENKDSDVSDAEIQPPSPRTTTTSTTQEPQSHLLSKPTQVRDFEPTLREITTTIRNLIVEWVLRQRALRFLNTIRQLLQTTTTTDDPLHCHRCNTLPDTPGTLSILGSCGHALCPDCTAPTLEKEECAVEGCRGSGKRFNIIPATTLGYHNNNTDHDHQDTTCAFGGSKIDKLIDIIRNDVPTNERVLLFIQFPDLMQVASKALALAGIKHTVISATDRKSTQKVERFQKAGFDEDKVLLLNLGSEMAAGLNLQCANHVIFLSPLLSQTQYDYDSAMIQAIGRCRRYGQTRHVHVYHLLARMTIDVNVFQERRGKVLIEREGKPVLVSDVEALDAEAITCQGPSLVVDNAF